MLILISKDNPKWVPQCGMFFHEWPETNIHVVCKLSRDFMGKCRCSSQPLQNLNSKRCLVFRTYLDSNRSAFVDIDSSYPEHDVEDAHECDEASEETLEDSC